MGKNLIKVGQGFDVHRFKKGKELKILGIKIPFNKSLEGHSDADVGFHSIVDAVLGALSKGDIGEHFPPSEQKWKNKPSIYFMTYAKNLLIDEGFKINNIDITLICEKPKIGPHKTKMIKSIAKIFHIDQNQFEGIRESRKGSDKLNPYIVLGCSVNDNFTTIRKKYIKLSKEHHPDVLVNKGVPPEIIEESKKKLSNFNNLKIVLIGYDVVFPQTIAVACRSKNIKFIRW